MAIKYSAVEYIAKKKWIKSRIQKCWHCKFMSLVILPRIYWHSKNMRKTKQNVYWLNGIEKSPFFVRSTHKSVSEGYSLLEINWNVPYYTNIDCLDDVSFFGWFFNEKGLRCVAYTRDGTFFFFQNDPMKWLPSFYTHHKMTKSKIKNIRS